MNRFFQLLLDPRVLAVLGLAALLAFLFLGAQALQIGLIWVGIVLGVLGLIWLGQWGYKRWRTRRAAAQLEQDLQGNMAEAAKKGSAKEQAETAVIRDRLRDAIKTIKSSKLGETSGNAALYELPWYMIIGNPAAGKSTAIVQSGLKFPFSRGTDNIIQGIGGTRNCDWFFTNEGILIDTAGRYAVHEEDRAEWMSFLGMLKRNRPKAPINGILIAASLAELSEARPEATIQLAKSLRQRVQELTEALEVFAPVYVLFTKADLIAGFVEFFEDQEPQERERVWGATLPYQPEKPLHAVESFDQQFEQLQDGLKEVALARMSLNRGKALSPAVLAFPLEFAAVQPTLRSFIATLFEENPYQYRPVFRGFYFTSAIQMGEANNRVRNGVAEQFALAPRAERTTAMVMSENGFFLRDLFSKVIFADRHLVKQHASRAKTRLRMGAFAGGALVLALCLGGWSWAYVGNRQLTDSVVADLSKATKLQEGKADLASRIEALELLQNRAEELASWRDQHPWTVDLGLYQGDALERKLKQEYFYGLRRLMLEPVAQALEGYLGEVNANASELKPISRVLAAAAPAAPEAASAPAATPVVSAAKGRSSRYVQASPTDVEDAYKALKTYLMLADQSRMEASHLTDQVTRFWRVWLDDNRGNMPRDQLMRSAERMITFAMANLTDPAFPVLNSNFSLVDQTRDNLRRVVQGTPALDRVYADVKARASTRFAPMTVMRIVGERNKDTVAGSYMISGAFTREAWEKYVNEAFKQAAIGELQSADWVLKTATSDDLSLQGSPEQIRKTLTDRYKNEYVQEWQRFLQGVTVADFSSFGAAVEHMNLLGDASTSPIRKLMLALFEQTSWDNPSLLNDRLARTQAGFVEWFRQTVLRMSPSRLEVKVDVATGETSVPMGPVGKAFADVARLTATRDGAPSMVDTYVGLLGKLRSHFNQMKTAGDPGPEAKRLMAATLDGSGSELSDALKFVDEQMLNGATDVARSAIKPMLVRPLMQAFSALVPPVETELNRLWAAQVALPFKESLAAKYPFDASSRVEADAPEIARVFGPAGAVSKFATESLGTLVTRRGDSIGPREWAELGLHLRPEFVSGFPQWVAPLDGVLASRSGATPAAGAGATAAAANAAKLSFQLLPQGAPGLIEYQIEIDGQVLKYRNGTAEWVSFSWPGMAPVPGARITAITLENKTVEVFNSPGAYGFEKLIEAAQVSKLPNGIRQLQWGEGRQAVSVQYRAVTNPGPLVAPPTAAGGTAPASGGGLGAMRGLRLPELVAGETTSAAAAAASGAAR